MSLSGYLTSEGRGASGETRPDAACQPCRCLPKINQLYLSSKPLISEQEENGLAIKLEREGEFIALSHFTFHGYFTSVLIYTCQSDSYHWHWHSVLLPHDRGLSYLLSAQIFRAHDYHLGPEREFLCGLGQWVRRYHDVLCRVTPSSGYLEQGWCRDRPRPLIFVPRCW